jgi:hypothetical protein
MPNKLTDLTITEGSLVDKPANKLARVLLFKRDQSPDSSIKSLLTKFLDLFREAGMPEEKVASLTKDMMDGMEPAQTFDDVQAANAMREMIGEFWDLYMAMEDSVRSIANDSTVDRPALIQSSLDQFVAAVQALFTDGSVGKSGKKISDARMKKLKGMHELLTQIMHEQDPENPLYKGDTIQKGATAMSEGTGQLSITPADVMKNLPEEIRVKLAKFDERELQFAAIQKTAEEAMAVAKAEREARETIEFAKRAETEWSYLPGDLGTKVSVLKAVAQLPKEVADHIGIMLKAANAQIKESKLFAAHGVDGVRLPADDAVSEVTQRAQGLIAKNTSLNLTDAISQVLKTDTELYDRYRHETQVGVK